MRRSTGAMASILLLATAGCSSMSIRMNALADDVTPADPATCAPRLFSSSSDFLSECTWLAEMSLDDAGFTRTKYCGAIQVRDEVRRAACELGGNAAVITRVSNAMSTCAIATAVIYQCPADRMPERPAWAPPPSVPEPEDG